MRLAVRVLGVVVLLGAVTGLCLHYGANEERADPYPKNEALATDYDAHVGEDTLVFGTVRDIDRDANTATVEVDSDVGPFDMTVTGFSGSVQPGGVVQVYGVLRPERTIDATNVAVVNPAGSSNLYKYAVSAVGAVLVLALFFRQWRFDPDGLAFEVRDDG